LVTQKESLILSTPIQNFICLASIVCYQQHTEDFVHYVVTFYILGRELNKIHDTALYGTIIASTATIFQELSGYRKGRNFLD
jgi:hypothetical protein